MKQTVGKRLLAIVACVACTQGACRKPPIPVDISQPGSADQHFGQIVVQVQNNDKDAVVKVNGETVRGVRGAWTSYVPAISMPLGPNQVHVTVITPRLGTRTQDVPFDRTPVDTYLKIDGLSGTPTNDGACRGDVCACAGVNVDADGAAHMRVRAAIGATVEIEGEKLVVPDPMKDIEARQRPFGWPSLSPAIPVGIC